MPEIPEGRQFPQEGMTYRQSIKTGIRHAKEGSGRVVESMANQVERCEGKKAGEEFRREAYSKGNEYKGRKYF